MLADPARRTLLCRVPHAASAAPSSVPITRCCPWLRTARHRQLGPTGSCRSPFLGTVRGRGHTLSAQYSLINSDHSHRCLRGMLAPSSGKLVYQQHGQVTPACYLWPNDSAPSVIDCAWEPFRLYGSLRAVNVLLAGLRSTLHCARSAKYVELHIFSEMLSLQKC
jgi:hypothetical protein